MRFGPLVAMLLLVAATAACGRAESDGGSLTIAGVDPSEALAAVFGAMH